MKRPIYLSHYDGSRRNNFTALRFLLAWMVIFAHGFALQPVAGFRNPVSWLLQGSTTTGQMAVDGFFVISGFLVAGSLMARGVREYALSRLLRLAPGLVVCVLLTVFILGPIGTSLSPGGYFSNSATYRYLTNALVLPFTVYTLPGVFEHNTNGAVNGSLWSIPYEARCYIALGIAGALGLLARRRLANLCGAGVVMLLLASYANPELLGILQHVSSALLCFPIGVLAYLNRHRLPLDGRLALAALFLLYCAFGEWWFCYVYPFSWSYLLFYLAYRTQFLNLDNKVGDFSYGIYIYAFPIQQFFAYALPSGNPFTNILLTTAAVIPIAAFSWFYIEKPALRLKPRR